MTSRLKTTHLLSPPTPNWAEASRHSPGGHEMVVVHHLDKRLHLGPVLDFLLAHSSCDFPREAIYPSHQTVSVWLVLCTVIMVLQHKHQHLQLGVIWHAVFIWLVMVLQHKHQHLQLYDIWQAVSVWLALPVYHHCGSATQASASTTLCHLAGSVHTACPPCVPSSWFCNTSISIYNSVSASRQCSYGLSSVLSSQFRSSHQHSTTLFQMMIRH